MNETNVKSNQSIQGGQSPLPKARIQDDIDASSYLKTSTAESNAIEHIFTEVTDAFATMFTAPSTDNIQSSGVYPNSINNGRVNATDKNSRARVNALLKMDVLSSMQELRSNNGTENVSHTNVNEMSLKSKIPLLRKPSFSVKKGPVCKDHSETKSKLPLLRKRSAKDDGSSPTCTDSSVASTEVKVPAKEPVSSRLALEVQRPQRKEPAEEPFEERFEEHFEEEEESPEDLNILDKIFDAFFPDDYDDATSVSSGLFSFNSDPSYESDSDEDEVTDNRDPDEFPEIRAEKPHAAQKKLLRKAAKLKQLRKHLADEKMKKKLDQKDKQIEILSQQLNNTKEELVETMASVKTLSAVVDSNKKNDKRASVSVRTAPAAAAQKNVPRSPKKQPIVRVPSHLLTHPSPNTKKYASAWDGKETDDDDHDEALALWYTSTELKALNQAVDCAITIARSQDHVSCSTYEM